MQDPKRLCGMLMGCVVFVLTQLTVVYADVTVSAAGNAMDIYGNDQTNSNAGRKKKRKVAVKPKMTQSTRTPVPSGTWGGDGIRLTIGINSATLTYACAQGEITEKLMVDKNGGFDAKGVHMNQTPGPIYEDRPPKRQPTRYVGRIAGSVMTLKVILTETNTVVSDSRLELGNTGRIRRCL